VIRLTLPTARVLDALIDQPSNWQYGYALMKRSGLASGTLYPLLARILEDGWLETDWEDSAEPGRPRRHLYRLTALGQGEARAALTRAREKWSLDLQTESP
jgi:PadR family transcriptional regulator PadR